MAIEFRIRKSNSASQPFYWDVFDKDNGRILAASETYAQKQSATNAADVVRKGAATAQILDYT